VVAVTPAAWLGDLIRAVAAVTPAGEAPDERVMRDIAKLLGMEEPVPVISHRGPKPDGPEPEPAEEETRQEEPAEPVRAPVRDSPPPRRPGQAEPAEQEQNPMAGLRTSWDETPPAQPPWTSEDVPSLPRLDAARLTLPLPHEPLQRRASTSAVVQALLSRQMPDSEVDVPALVEQLASGQAVSELPRLAQATLRFGAHVLVDRSDGMSLFWRDQRTLVDAIRNVVGAALTDVSVITGSPRRMHRKHQHPAPGRAVLALAGFGIRRGRAERDVWEAYVSWLRQRDCRVVALVPFTRDRWPAWLTALMPVVCWDRVTTIGAVRAALGRAS
jgi:hypothetical protein